MITEALKNTILLALLGFVGCATTPGARPQDMSTLQHEQAAAAHEQEAASHAAAYDLSARVEKQKCGDLWRPCWTLASNLTDDHKADAETHRKMAADHRAAAQALRN